jgi:hypothetical protein
MTTTAITVPLSDLERMAQSVAKSNLFGMKTADQAMALMLIAQAEGVHPARAIQEYHVIDGRPALRADAMLARFQASGGRVEWTEYTDKRVSGRFTHPQGGSVEIDWDQDRARAAGLLNRKNWQSYPRQMLRARCISEGVRTVYPGASSGIYTAEEVQDMVDVTPPAVPVVDAAPPAPTVLDESERADHLAALEGAADLADLKRAYSTAFAAAKQAGDLDSLNDFERAKDARKAALQEAA